MISLTYSSEYFCTESVINRHTTCFCNFHTQPRYEEGQIKKAHEIAFFLSIWNFVIKLGPSDHWKKGNITPHFFLYNNRQNCRGNCICIRTALYYKFTVGKILGPAAYESATLPTESKIPSRESINILIYIQTDNETLRYIRVWDCWPYVVWDSFPCVVSWP